MLKTLNQRYGLFLAVTTLLAFLAIAYHSYPKTQPYDVQGLNKLSWQATHRQATALQEVWNLTDDDIAKPVNLWRN